MVIILIAAQIGLFVPESVTIGKVQSGHTYPFSIELTNISTSMMQDGQRHCSWLRLHNNDALRSERKPAG